MEIESLAISEVTRRKLVDSLLLGERPFHGNMGLLDFLKRIWDLSSMRSTDSRFSSAAGDVWQHMVRNSDWDDAHLLYEYLDLAGCGDDIFLRFVEACVHPLVLNEEAVDDRVREFNRVLRHDGVRLKPTAEISGRSVFTVTRIRTRTAAGAVSYEIVLSFAGEDREYVEEVAEFLQTHDVEVFYDRFEEVTLWGKDLAEHLDHVYRSSARFCVMFISEHYAKKVWTNHERKSALARAIQERHEYILPARFDETELPGLRPTVGYVDLRRTSPERLGKMILAKLKGDVRHPGGAE